MRYTSLLLLGILWQLNAIAQPIRAEIPSVDYIHLDRSSLSFPGEMKYAHTFILEVPTFKQIYTRIACVN
jgi:hypothetical protein